MNISQALDDPLLFAPHFRGPSWDAWKVLIKGLFGLPMSTTELAIYCHHTERQTAPTVPFKEAAMICGRRGGKSRILALLAVFLGCFEDYSSRLAPGERATIAIIAADRRQARSIFRFVSGMLHNVEMLRGLVESETADAIALSNDVTIEIHTASFRVTRGYSLAAAICDEVAYWRSDESANPDQEILAALRPGLSNLDGLLLIASSPYAKRGAVYQAFRENFGQDGAHVLVWRGTTLEMNPTIDPGIIARAYEADAASAAAEFGAQFRDDVAVFVSREVVDAVTVPERYELPPTVGTTYFGFTDPSGGSSDSFTLAIAHREGDIVVLDLIRERKPPFSPDNVVAEYAKTLKTYNIRKVWGDRYASGWPPERFLEHGITYEPSERPKSQIYADALPLLNSGKAELLDLKVLTAQLCGLERRTARGGRDNIDHAPGARDDVANAALSALLLAGGRNEDVLLRFMCLGGASDAQLANYRQTRDLGPQTVRLDAGPVN